ncbi:MAG: hypothetical protein RSB38_04055, partial [Oscillospiraceae bacterium]
MKKLLSLLLICTIVMSVIIIPYQANADVNISGDMDDANVKYFLNYAFTNVLDRTGERRVSSFDINTAGGVLNPGPGLNITDTSTVLPVEASRKMKDITYGEVVMEFPIVLSNPLDGAKIVLQNDDKLVFGLYFDKDTIYCNGKDGENLPLQAYKTKAVYAVKITMDFDKKTVKNICIDGKQVAENLDFANNSQKANNILISTGAKATGTFGMQSIRIYRGYFINESFSMNGLGMPPDWDLSVENGEITASTANISASNTFDSGSATLSSEYGNSSLKKTIDKKTDKSIFEFQLLLPKKRAGAEISLTAGEKNLFSIFTTKDGFAYSDKNGNPVDFYKSMDNVWYHFRIEYDPQTGKADLIMNGKKQVMGIDLPPDIKYVDGVSCDVIPIGDGDVIIDNILLFPYEEIEDYVPEPVPVPKDDIDIGMQMCSLWTEGLHFGYDYLNDADARKPVLGFYDEGSPEVADWEIKYMVEHGVDFQWYCWFKA